MQAVQVLGRGAAVAFLLFVVSSVGVAKPLPMPGHTTASTTRGWLASSAADVPEACGRRAIACRPDAFGHIETAQLRTLSERFSAQLVEALRPAADFTRLHGADPATWALYADAFRGAGAQALAMPLAATGPTPDATLLENVTVIVQQVPEPSLLVNVLIGVAGWACASRRSSFFRGSR